MDFNKEKFENINVNYPGILIASELRALNIFVTSLDEFVPYIRDQYKLKETRKVKYDSEYPELHQSELQNIENVSKYIIPISFNNSAIIMMWSFFEASAKDLALYIRKYKNISLSINDISGRGLDKIKKYYSKVLNLPKLLEPYLEQLHYLYLMRNFIVHNNGVIENSYESIRNQDENSKIIKFINSHENINIYEGTLFCSTQYLGEAHLVVTNAIKSIDNFIADENDWVHLIQ